MNTISFNRLVLLIKRQWHEHYRVYLIGMALLAFSMAFLFAVTYHWRDSFSGGVRNGIFLIALFAGGGLFTSSLFNDLANKSRGIWLLALPASAFEKILSAAFFSVVIYLTFYIALFSMIDQAYVLLVSSPSMKENRIDLFKNGFYGFCFAYITFAGIVLLGSIYFNKAAFIKTMLVILFQFFLVSSGNNILLQLMTGLAEVTSNTPFSNFQFRNNGENVYVTLTDNSELLSTFIFRVIVPLTIWYLAYVRLKEKEL